VGALLADETQRNRQDDDDMASHAADEPTAVWDANTLREAGLGDLIKKPETDSDPPSAPATPGARNQGPSIMVDEAAAGAKAVRGPSMRDDNGELGWGATLGLAAGLGAAVYLLIRFLK
jgi:hypothetical protein